MTSGGAYDAGERRELENDLAAGGTLMCPSCRVELSCREVERTKEVAYMRRRVWVLCPQCRRTASLDRRSV